ncbi:Lysophospholipase L1-like esterase [Pseudomonas reidholzensis]|uniref:Lysophospholipase L1-like esterase n=1 Tax=Pseudomonas reidholzensis TaxID=1785162 RepID=A0A383RRR5_9PSED|nr:SGNH/GDSL hydrolase family protein [Pseudomonas reidholzensis]SYX89453.1 Lysophospholipase L1-like esterase [Pseudomonas reidholzensis]
MRYCLIALALFSLQAMAGKDDTPLQDHFIKCENRDCSAYTSSKFRMGDSFLTGRSIEGESFFADADSNRSFNTAFPPKKIIAVHNHNTGQLYKSGVDYLPSATGITIPEHSAIAFAPKGFITTATPEEIKNYGVRVTTEFQAYQYDITYSKESVFYPKIYGSLGSLASKLGNATVRITFYGDSITQGANATSSYAPPHQPAYPELVMARLSELYPGRVEYRNNSVGGWSAINAAKAVDKRVNDLPADLVVLAFGMNDAGAYAPAEYRKHIKRLIDSIRAKQPDSAILLATPIRANPQSFIQKHQYVDGYLESLTSLAYEYSSVAVVDLTAAWDRILENKRYYDVTGNGLNHPNDFGHRIIAEVVLDAIVK